MVQIRHPAARRIEPVVFRRRIELRQHGCVERVGGHRDEHFVAVLDHRAERQLDSLRRPGRDEDAVGADRAAVARVLGRHRLARLRNARRRPVSVVAVAQRALHRRDQMHRRLKSEGDRIADVEVADARPRGLDALRLGDDVADGVGKAVDARRRRNRGLRLALRVDDRHARILRHLFGNPPYGVRRVPGHGRRGAAADPARSDYESGTRTFRRLPEECGLVQI